MGLIVHDMYIYNSLLAILKVLIIFYKFYRFQDFMITTRLDPVFGGIRLSHLYYVIIFLLLRFVLVQFHITVIMTTVFMTTYTSGIFTV